MNAQCKPIGMYSISGSLSEVSAYPRVVVTYALLTNAHSVFFTHNHPGGTCAPSNEDIHSTKLLKGIFDKLQIMLLDHMITPPGYSGAAEPPVRSELSHLSGGL